MADIQNENEGLAKFDGIEEIVMSSYQDPSSGVIDTHTKVPNGLPESLGDKTFALLSPPEQQKPMKVYFASAGSISNQFSMIGTAEQEGWKLANVRGSVNTTNKTHLLKLTSRQGESFIAIPITKSHFADSNHTSSHQCEHLIIDEETLKRNPNFAIKLNHQQIPVVNVNGTWNVPPGSVYAKAFSLDGKSVQAKPPTEMYLLSEGELAEYKKEGKKAGWVEKEGVHGNKIRAFEKLAPNSSGIPERVETRYAKEVVVGGERKYVLSSEDNIRSIRPPKEKPAQTAEITIPAKVEPAQTQPDKEKMNKKIVPFPGLIRSQKKSSAPATGEAKIGFVDTVLAKLEKEIKEKPGLLASAKPEELAMEAGNLKIHFKDMALPLSDEDRKVVESYLRERAAADEITEVVAILHRLVKETASIGTMDQDKTKTQAQEGGRVSWTNVQGRENPATQNAGKPSEPANAREVAASTAASVLGGGVSALGGAVKGISDGIAQTISTLVEKHHERKMFKLNNPDYDQKRQEINQDRLKKYRNIEAKASNGNIDAKMESVLRSKKFFEEHPTVRQIFDIVGDDPSKMKDAQEWVADLAKTDQVLAQHYDNIREGVGFVAANMTDNLEKNRLAENNVEDRVAKFEKFHDKLAENQTADTILDKEGKTTLREILAKLTNNLAKFFKEFCLRNKNGADQANDQSTGTAMGM